MAADWEDLFRRWSRPASETEEERCENATRMIRDAVRSNAVLAGYDIAVFAQGSYRNNTNVRQDSDVDICVCRRDVIHCDFSNAPGLSMNQVGLTPITFSFHDWKNELHRALLDKFGGDGVTKGNKAFDVHPNSYRVSADAVPAFTLRSYYSPTGYAEGTYLSPDVGRDIENYPQQQYENGVQKNLATNRRFKAIARALKRLRNVMVEDGNAAAKLIPSFLIECLVFNTPNWKLGGDSYWMNLRNVIAHAHAATESDEACKDWLEVNNIKYLFHPTQPWSRQQVNAFCVAVWSEANLEAAR